MRYRADGGADRQRGEVGSGAARGRAAGLDTLRARAWEELGRDVRGSCGQRAGGRFPGGLQAGQGCPAEGAPEWAAAPGARAVARAHEAA